MEAKTFSKGYTYNVFYFIIIWDPKPGFFFWGAEIQMTAMVAFATIRYPRKPKRHVGLGQDSIFMPGKLRRAQGTACKLMRTKPCFFRALLSLVQVPRFEISAGINIYSAGERPPSFANALDLLEKSLCD